MADVLNALNQLLQGGGYGLSPDELEMYRRQPPRAPNVPPSTSSEPSSLPSIFGDPRFSIELQGGGSLGGNASGRQRLGRQMLGSVLGGGFPVPGYQQGQIIDPRQPLFQQGTLSSEGWQPGIGLRFRQPF